MNTLLPFILSLLACNPTIGAFFSTSIANPDYQPNFKELDGKEERFESPYSSIIVRDSSSKRSMYFVRDSGQIVLESSLDMTNPSLLIVPYTRVMMGAFILQPNTRNTLMIGLGGGAMAHFLQVNFREFLYFRLAFGWGSKL